MNQKISSLKWSQKIPFLKWSQKISSQRSSSQAEGSAKAIELIKYLEVLHLLYGLPRWLSGKECRGYRRRRFNPWVGNFPWKRKWQPMPVFSLGKPPWTKDKLWQAIVRGIARVRQD